MNFSYSMGTWRNWEGSSSNAIPKENSVLDESPFDCHQNCASNWSQSGKMSQNGAKAQLRRKSRGSRVWCDFVRRGGMAEWSMAVVLKTTVRETVPGVRIPLPPPAQAQNVLERVPIQHISRLPAQCVDL